MAGQRFGRQFFVHRKQSAAENNLAENDFVIEQAIEKLKNNV